VTVDPVKDFDVWFGALFVAIGVVALIVGGALGVYFIRRPPRRQSSLLFLLLPLGLGLSFSMVGGIFANSGLAAQQLEQRLHEVGVTAQARVLYVERTGTRLNGRYLFRIRYEYRDSTGRSYEGSSGYLERSDAERYRDGDLAFIRYDPASPSSSIWLGPDEQGQRAPLAGASG
jgi:hypothetical protein